MATKKITHKSLSKTQLKKQEARKQAEINQILNEQTQLSKLEKAQASLLALQERRFKMLFFVPETKGIQSGAVIEIYNQAAVMRRQGFDAYVLAERRDYQVPDYLDQNLQALPHLYAEGVTFPVAPEDWLIIPEFFTPLMEQTKKLSCTRVVLAQSFDYTITSNLGGMTWKNYGMEYVLATSERMKTFIEEWHGPLYDIQTYQVGVPEYFKPAEFKRPVIAFFSRNADDIKRVSKLFYYKFPHLQWVVFEDLRCGSRTDFAKKIGEAEICLFLDRIAAFGQPPLEAMKSDTVVVALAPDIIPEYMEKPAGLWTQDYYQVPMLLGQAMEAIVEDKFPANIRETMKEVAQHYTQDASDASIVKAYEHFMKQRQEILEEAVEIETKMEAQLKADQAVNQG
jgi:hypothetical protein